MHKQGKAQQIHYWHWSNVSGRKNQRRHLKVRKEKGGVCRNTGPCLKHPLLSRRTDSKLMTGSVWMAFMKVLEIFCFGGPSFLIYKILPYESPLPVKTFGLLRSWFWHSKCCLSVSRVITLQGSWRLGGTLFLYIYLDSLKELIFTANLDHLKSEVNCFPYLS